jgi:hypothetical protein
MRFVSIAILGGCLLVLALAGNAPKRRLGRPVADMKSAPAVHEPQPVTEQEWVEKVLPWMRKVRPNQAAVLDNMPDGTRKEQAKQLVANQYRDINRILDPTLKKARLNEIAAQDELFGAQVKFNAARRSGLRGPKLDEARGAVQTAVEHVFDAQIADRQARINRLQSEIDQLTKNKATTVARWTRQAINEGRSAVNAAPPQLHSPGESTQDNAEPAGKH